MGKRKKAAQVDDSAAAAIAADHVEDRGFVGTGEATEIDLRRLTGVVTVRSQTVRTLEGTLEAAQVDTTQWEVEHHVINKWDGFAKTSSAKLAIPPRGAIEAWVKGISAIELWQVKLWLRRKGPQVRGVEALLEKLREHSPIIPAIRRPKPRKGQAERILEISVIDPHLGLHCFAPGADKSWSLEECEQMVMVMIERLLDRARPFAPFQQIVMPIGHDFLHADNVWGTTTAGTEQPEADAWQHVFQRAQELAIAMIDRLKQEAPVRVLIVMGNHARETEFALGRVVGAYYHNDENVEVDASASPYKFHHYGVNLIGFDHGHSITPIRLAALMANECRDVWAETAYREWHLGDQHRKGSAKPCTFEEQGVSVEYLPGLTPPNEWHRLKSYNWQKRAGMAFVWDKRAGAVARLQVNINSYTGKEMDGR